MTLTFAPGQEMGLVIPLTPRVVPMGIYGRVTSASSGEPIPNALIQAYYVKAAFTDINGYYEINLYTPGTHTVVCYGESHVTGLSSASISDGEAVEVNFDLEPQPGIAEPMYPPRRMIYCGAGNISPVLDNNFEVISDEGYADHLLEWLEDPSIEYAYLVAEHGSPSVLQLRCRVGYLTLYAWKIRSLLGDRQYKLSLLSACNTVDADGSPLASAFGGSVLGQSLTYWRCDGIIEFFTYLACGLSALQAYMTVKSDVTDPRTMVGLLTYYGDNRPGFRLA